MTLIVKSQIANGSQCATSAMNDHQSKHSHKYHSSSCAYDGRRKRGGVDVEKKNSRSSSNVELAVATKSKSNTKQHGTEIITCMEEMKKQYAISKQLLQVYGDYLTSIRATLSPLQNIKSILGFFYEKEWSQAKVLMDVLEDTVTVWSVYADELNRLKDSIQKYFDLFEEVQNVLDEWVEIRDTPHASRHGSPSSKNLRSLSEVEDDLMQRFKVAFASRIHLILGKYFGGYMKALKCFGKDLSKAASKGQEILEALPSTNPLIPLGRGVPAMTLWDVWYEAKATVDEGKVGDKSVEKREICPPSEGKKSKQKNCEFVYSYIDP